MSKDLLQKLEKDKNFQAEVKAIEERYHTLEQASHYSQTTSVPETILKKVNGNRQLYFYFGFQQPTLKKQMYQVALFLIKNFQPNVHKPYTLVFFNEKCKDNYVLWNFRETFCCRTIDQIAAIEEFIVVKPSFYQKTMDWITFGTIPKFIRSKTKFVSSYQELCNHLKCSINILAQNVPVSLYEHEFPNLFSSAMAMGQLRGNMLDQEDQPENEELQKFQKLVKSMFTKAGHEVNNLDDYEIGAEGVPNILKMLVFYFDSHQEGLHLEGLFRKSVSIDQENETISQVLQKNYDYLLEVQNPHIIANLIKRFFTSLKTPAFPFNSFSWLMNDQGKANKTEHLKQVYSNLPEVHKRVLIFIFTFFKEKVIKNQAHNKMGIQNVSICFAPCIFRSEHPSAADLIYATKAVLYCKIMLTEFQAVFGSEEEREAVYRKSYMETKKNFQENLDMGIENAINIADTNLDLVKNNSRVSHHYSDKQLTQEIGIQLQPEPQLSPQLQYQTKHENLEQPSQPQMCKKEKKPSEQEEKKKEISKTGDKKDKQKSAHMEKKELNNQELSGKFGI